MKLIVTGASGQYGRAAVEGILCRVPPEDMIVTTRNPGKLADLAERGVTVRTGDFDDPSSLVKAFKGGNKLLMISTGQVGRRLAQHHNAIRSAAEASVRHIVYTSFIGAGGGSPALVVKEHGETEALLRQSGMTWTALRDSQYTEAMVDVAAPLAVASGRWIASAGDGKVGFVTRSDCVASAVAVMTTSGHANTAYDITGPELLSFRDVAAIAATTADRPVEYVIVDDEALYRHFDTLGIPREALDNQSVKGVPWSSNDMVSFEQGIRGGFLAVLSDDVERLTGRKPISLESCFRERQASLRSIGHTRSP